MNYFLDSHHANIRKIRAVASSILLLLDNGRIYVCGSNNAGMFATRKNPRVVEDNYFFELTKIIDDDFKGDKINDFKISANSQIFITEAGSVFYSGMHSKFRPTPFPYTGVVKNIFATFDSVGVIGENGEVLFLNDKFIENSYKKGDVYVSRDPNLKNVIEIGGNYQLRYALVQNK